MVFCAGAAACPAGPEPPATCVATRECAAGQRCVAGLCKPRDVRACTSEVECGTGGACVEAVCLGGTACRTSADCGSGEGCDIVQGLCVLAECDVRGACPNGGSCNFALNRCGPRRACTRDDQCGAPDGLCDGGFCAPGCRKTSCPAGQTCSTATGRCGSANPCSGDEACGPPSNICEGGACVAGCGTAGCTQGTCNTTTGRCGAGGCTDASCGAPANVCEDGRCVPGCASAGCTGGASCNPATGRCAGGDCTTAGCDAWDQCNFQTKACEPRSCGSDQECSPPVGTCTGTVCAQGCMGTGCTTGSCDQATGRCSGGSTGTGTNPACTNNRECTGRSCLMPGTAGATSGVCADMCSQSFDCPAGFACVEPPEARGVKACLAGPSPYAAEPGGSCGNPPSAGNCHSGLCLGNARDGYRCANACSRDEDCSGGTQPCLGYAAGGSSFVQACGQLVTALFQVFPEPCIEDYSYSVNLFCADPQGNFAFTPCCTAAECYNPYYGVRAVCVPLQPYYIGDALLGTGPVRRSSTWMKGCLPAPDGLGSDPLGSPCTLSTPPAATDGLNCASQLCVDATYDGTRVTPYCSSFCCNNADCGYGFACVPFFDPGMGTSVSVCARM